MAISLALAGGGAQVTLLAPWGLALALVGIPLTALYFLKVRRKRATVPSVLLWQALARARRSARPWERFQSKLLLWVQLLILALLALALAQPVGREAAISARAQVVILDRTASMGARDGDPTRLDTARAEARRWLRGLGDGDEVLLLAVGAQPEVLAPFSRDRAALTAALAELRPSDAEGSLLEALTLAAALLQGRPDGEIHLWSDGSLAEPLEGLPAVPIALHPVGSGSQNTAITALDLAALPGGDLQRQLFVTVAQFGAPAEVEVSLALNGALQAVQAQRLDPGEPTSLVFPLPGDVQGRAEVWIEADGDLLPADNRGYAILAPIRPRKIALVQGDWLTAAALEADPRVDLTLITTESPKLVGFDAAFFGTAPPKEIAGVPYAVLGPFDSAVAQFQGEGQPNGALTWDRAHPLNRFVDWTPVLVGKSPPLHGTPAVPAVVEGVRGPLLLAGERGGNRVAVLTFDPLQSDLPLRVGWPVFLMNAVSWLTDRPELRREGELLRAGTPWTAPFSGREARCEGPSGPCVAQFTGDLARVADTEIAGFYQLDLGAVRREFAANTLSRREAEIAVRRAFPATTGAPSAGVAHTRAPWWPALLAAAAALLLGEWLLYHLRRRDG